MQLLYLPIFSSYVFFFNYSKVYYNMSQNVDYIIKKLVRVCQIKILILLILLLKVKEVSTEIFSFQNVF